LPVYGFFLHSFEFLVVRGLFLQLSFQSCAYADVQIKAKELKAMIVDLFIIVSPLGFQLVDMSFVPDF
jgi:hypothetical protein